MGAKRIESATREPRAPPLLSMRRDTVGHHTHTDTGHVHTQLHSTCIGDDTLSSSCQEI